MTRRLLQRLTAALLAGLLTSSPAAAAAQQREPSGPPLKPLKGVETVIYDRVIEVYRSGATARAVDELDRLLAPGDVPRRGDSERQLTAWILEAQRRNRQADLEALLLLCTEAMLRAWPERSSRPPDVTPYWGWIDRLERTVRRLDPKSRFLRAWYLLWESFRQQHFYYRSQAWPEYLDEALEAFPDHPLILLAAGARQELRWWMSFENAPRNLDRVPAAVTNILVAGRDYLRRSVAAEPQESEARLRLARVLLELDELDEAARVLSSTIWAPDEPAFEHLARLFEGDLHERRGDLTAALAAYDRAIALIAKPQSARVAKAHALHLAGQRPDAAQTATDVLTDIGMQADPWWVYLGGQGWRLAPYLKVARALVVK